MLITKKVANVFLPYLPLLSLFFFPGKSTRSKFIPSESKLFQAILESVFEPFRNDPKNILYLVWWKTVKNQSDLIQFNRNESELSFQSESIRTRIYLNRTFNQNYSESFRLLIHSYWFWLKIRFGSIRARIDQD